MKDSSILTFITYKSILEKKQSYLHLHDSLSGYKNGLTTRWIWDSGKILRIARGNAKCFFNYIVKASFATDCDVAISHFRKKKKKKTVCKIIRSESRRVRGTTSERVTACRRFVNAYMFLACVCTLSILLVSIIEINIDCRCVIIELI